MSIVFDMIGENVRYLGFEWSRASAGWRDESAYQFERDHWDRLVEEARAIEEEAQTLRESLQRARAVLR